ncbi:MAG: hypothetical protein QM820_43280 [Minicystis sp.]
MLAITCWHAGHSPHASSSVTPLAEQTLRHEPREKPFADPLWTDQEKCMSRPPPTKRPAEHLDLLAMSAN